MLSLGIDTSNYSTSISVFSSDENRVVANYKQLLTVEAGKTGLRQSDAVFLHTRNLPDAIDTIAAQVNLSAIDVVGVSTRPRPVDGSYMPCFLSGLAVAKAFAAARNIPLHTFSHQEGHVTAALFGTEFGIPEKKDFIAFHVSGGTTDAILCGIDGANTEITPLSTSLDLFAGQAVDRVGHMLGLDFPAGEALSALAETCDRKDFARPVIKDGDCCLSGLQNQCEAYFKKTGDAAATARYCLLSIAETVDAMTQHLRKTWNLDVIYAGGVMSSSVIRKHLLAKRSGIWFSDPPYLSADNAVGTAILACRAERYKNNG